MEELSTRLTYDQCIERMTRYRRLEAWCLYMILSLPGFLFFGITPVRVVSLWILGLLGSLIAHIYRVRYRNLAKQIYEAAAE